MIEESLSTLSSEKIHNTLFKYWLHPQKVYICVKDANRKIIFDNAIEVDTFKIDKLVNELHKLSNTYHFEIFIRYKGYENFDTCIKISPSL